MRLVQAILSILLLMAPLPARAQEAVLATLEWPPYVSASLPGQGASAAIIRSALAAEGIGVRFVFLPWNRAIEAARRGEADGFFPAYRRPPNPAWTVSRPIGAGPIHFAERRSRPIRWTRLEDLGDFLIGVNAGFVNTDEIDSRLADKRLHGDVSLSDEQNLRKLAAGRIDLAVIDANVFNFAGTQAPLADIVRTLQLQEQPLEVKELFVDFRSGERGERLRAALDRGLAATGAGSPEGIAALQARLVPQ